MTVIERNTNFAPETIEPDYDLSVEQRGEIFSDEIRRIGDMLDDNETNVLVVGTTTPLANVVRSIESDRLPTIPDLMEKYEDSSRFVLVLEDKHDGNQDDFKPAHIFRINRTDGSSLDEDTLTGLPTFDDVLKLGKVTEEELLDFYGTKTLQELGTEYLNVETNIAVEGIRPSYKKPYSALGYRAIFDLVKMEQVRGVVAYQNPEAMRSIARIGLRHTPLLGNPEISVEDVDKSVDGNENQSYYPLTIESIPWSKLLDSSPMHNNQIFTDPGYAERFSRIAALVARKKLNIISIV